MKDDKQSAIPSIETEILTVLDPAQRENALAFTAYLRENGLTPRRWFGPGFWIVPSENGNLFGIHFYGLNPKVNNRGWVLWFFAGPYSGSKDQELAEFVWAHVGRCVKCDAACASQGVNMSFFGRSFTKVCYQFPVRVDNPDRGETEKVKKLIDFWKGAAANSRGLHVH